MKKDLGTTQNMMLQSGICIQKEEMEKLTRYQKERSWKEEVFGDFLFADSHTTESMLENMCLSEDGKEWKGSHPRMIHYGG
jgi:hypothetical protein